MEFNFVAPFAPLSFEVLFVALTAAPPLRDSKICTFGFQLDMHLPLSLLDARNDPSEMYLTVQDGLTLGCGMLWGTAYFLYIRQAIRDESYGMPMFAL